MPNDSENLLALLIMAGDRIVQLENQLGLSQELERLWYDRYYTLFVSCKEAKDSPIFVDWARQVNDKYREKK